MKSLSRTLAVFALLTLSGLAQATDVARSPLGVHGSVAPNVIFGMDDSGSMDMEVMLPTNEGLFWWHEANSNGWNSSGTFHVNATGLSNTAYTSYLYLFPVGCSDAASGGAARRLCDSTGVAYALPATPQFAALRSNAYNPLYYNPKFTYMPWAPATLSGVEKTFSNAPATAAPLHPLFTSTLDLTVSQDRTDANWTFHALKGMTIPKGARYYASKKWNTLAADTVVGSSPLTGSVYEIALPYVPAAYWNKEACSVNGTTCVAAPDGGTLKYYAITAATTKYPSGRGYADELQNFANWFTYYRKRKLMLGASMGQVLDELSGMRVGLSEFNVKSATNVTMYSTDSDDNKANARVVAGLFYRNLAKGGTPTRDMLKYIGTQFDENQTIVTAACQRNAAFVVTDGYANYTSVSAPTYKQATYGTGTPYATTHAGSLADLALAYYTRQLRSDLTAGLVPAAGADNTSPSADRNKNLHVNTYGITLGAKGKLWPGITDPYAQKSISWVNPTSDGMPESIDDLWHATINGRGSMFLATTPQETAANIQAALAEIQRQAGAQGAVTFSTVNLRADNSTAYVGSYGSKAYSGELLSYKVDPATGEFADKPTWSAGALLVARDWTERVMASFNGSKGVEFTTTNLGALKNLGLVANDEAVAYFRGDRSLESTVLRQRTGIMGAVLTAEAVVDNTTSVVYVASGEGAVHAFDKATGKELWAYVPGFVVPDMGAQLSKTWNFETMLDGTPVLAKVGSSKYLVGGRGSAGAGVYAIDVTSANKLTTDEELAAAVLWEFPNSDTPADVKALLGATVGKPLVVDTAAGSVVVVASGYFPDKDSTGDGKARVFVLDAKTGKHLSTIEAPAVTGDSGEAGLSALSGWLESDGKVRYVYGGDERGHLWRFDLDKSAVLRLMTLTDKDGTALPITAAPELAKVNNRRMVFVGTGRFLGESDFSDSRTHSFFAVWDDGTTVSSRKKLAERTISTATDGTRSVTGVDMNWELHRGWVVTLPKGEKANTDPALGSGVIVFTTNAPSKTECSASSALYVASASTGTQLPKSAFPDGAPWFGKPLGSSLTAKPVLTRLTSDKLGITTRQSDGTQETRTLNVGSAAAPQKTTWRELLR